MNNELVSLEKELLSLRSEFICLVDQLELVKAKAKLKELEYLSSGGFSPSDGFFLEIGKDGVEVKNNKDTTTAAG